MSPGEPGTVIGDSVIMQAVGTSYSQGIVGRPGPIRVSGVGVQATPIGIHAAGEGGGLYIYQNAVIAQDVDLSYNTAEGDGGGLYKNNNERVSGLFNPVKYPGGVSWLAQAEFTAMGQTLKDPENTGSTTIQKGYAGDVNVRVMIDRMRFRFDASYRTLAARVAGVQPVYRMIAYSARLGGMGISAACKVVESGPGDLGGGGWSGQLLDDCDSEQGASGAALIASAEGRHRLVGIRSGTHWDADLFPAQLYPQGPPPGLRWDVRRHTNFSRAIDPELIAALESLLAELQSLPAAGAGA